jgi:hypothetical protein
MPSTRSLDHMAYIPQSAYLIPYLSAGLPLQGNALGQSDQIPHLLTRKSARSKNSIKSRRLPSPPPPMINVATGLKGNACPISLIQKPEGTSRGNCYFQWNGRRRGLGNCTFCHGPRAFHGDCKAAWRPDSNSGRKGKDPEKNHSISLKLPEPLRVKICKKTIRSSSLARQFLRNNSRWNRWHSGH